MPRNVRQPASIRRPRKRTWWGRLTRFVGGVAALLGLLALVAFMVFAGWLRSDHFQRWVGTQAEALLERETCEQATLTRVQVSFLPPFVAIDGLHVWDEASDETIASVERIRIPLVLRDGGPAIGRLQAQRPVVQLHFGEDGKLQEFCPPPAEPKPRRPISRLPFGSLDVVDAAIRVYHPKFEASLEDLDIRPVDGPVSSVSSDLHVKINGLDTETRFTWTDVVLGPETIEIPDLEIRSPLLVLDGPVRIDLDGPLDVALTGEVHLEELTPALVAPRQSHGEAAFDLSIFGPPQDPTVGLAVQISDFGLDLPGKFTPLLTYELGDVVAAVTATQQRVSIEQATVFWGEEGKLSVWGEIDVPNKRLIDGHGVGSRLSLAHLLRAFDAAPNPWIDMSTDLEVSLAGPLSPLELSGQFDYLVADLKVADRPIDQPDRELMLDIPRAIASGELTLFKDHVVLRIDEVVTPRNQGNGTVDIGFGPKGPLDLTATLWDADLRDFQPLRGVEMTGHGRVSGRFQGPFNALGFEGWADLDDFSVLDIPYADHITARLVSPRLKTIELHDAKVTRGKSSYGGFFAMGFKPLTMDTDVVISRGRVEDMVGMFVDLEGMKGDLNGTLSLHGPLYDLDGEAHLDLRRVDLWGEQFEVGRGDGYMDKGRFTLDDLRVTRHGGSEGLVLRGSVDKAWKLDMELMAGGIDLARSNHLAGKPVQGKVALHSRITNTLFDPSPAGRLVLTGLRWLGSPLGDSVVWFDSRDGVATWHGLLLDAAVTVDGTQGLWQEQQYHLVADLDAVPVHAFWPVAADGQAVSATASGQVELAGHFGETWSPVDLTADLGDVRVAWDRHVLTNPVPWRYTQRGDAWSLEGFSLEGGATRIVLNATGGSTLDVQGNGQVDLDLLRAVVPGVQRASGLATVRVDAEGVRPDVEAVVNVDLKADILRYAYVPATFEDTSVQLRVTKDRIDIVSVQGSLGGGTLTAGGSIDSEAWVPKRYALSGRVDDAQIQWVDSLPPATGDAELFFDGPTDALLLSGDVRIDEMSFSDRIDWEDWVVEARDTMLVDAAELEATQAWFSNNVAIRAEQTIYLRNNVADGMASADLRVIGDTARPGLVGEVNVAPGTLAYLQDREFRVDRGQLRFADPWTWDPDVDFVLVSDIINQDQTYRVSYLVSGPFSNWGAGTISEPPLPQADVNALLWFGVTTDQLEAMGQLSAAVAQSMADLVLSDFFLRSDAGAIRDELPDFLSPDRVDLATGVNARGEYSPEPRLVVEKRLDDVWDVQLSWEMNLVHPEDDYVSVEKRIGGIWSLSAWYASLQRARVLPIGGAYGVDVTATWELQ